ncbi:hypothetical protein SGGMMB4_04276 [Sodalis glossinidius str. 'morsitans']|uniref:Uncharacterized protein n=1 Tax=Sodalis glossinidius (strain morsitans) TaxID=343509 RepID=Q2NRW4_SODGM|nr:hypothetical protein [Sodalis glossinidius]BAE75111.1 hypothetical protein SG1836 [Sodalis glossinidius str. 'morsitans']CRL46041.1 hypothetical protein SGGMMB4_04276 [Sodalis glossinidius str. 'morsitans']
MSVALAFYQLRDMAYLIHFDKFRASVTADKEGHNAISFEIDGVMDKRSISYGRHHEDVNAIKRQTLTNSGEFLDSAHVGDRQIEAALAEVSYDKDLNLFTVVYQGNWDRLCLDRLTTATKDAMAMHPSLAQEWLTLHMKSFDYFARLRSSRVMLISGV